MTTPLLIVGAGGFSREAAEAVLAVNDVRPTWDLLGFADDNPALQGKTVDGIEVVGPVEATVRQAPKACLAIGVGRPDNYFSRARLVRKLRLPPERYATIVHPASSIARGATVGPGTVVLAGVVVTARATVGSHVAVMPGTVVTHDDVIGDYVTLASGVRLGGSVSVEVGAYVGAGALVREGLTIGSWAMVGMGALVTRSVPDAQRWFGSPARHQSDVSIPDDLLTGS